MLAALSQLMMAYRFITLHSTPASKDMVVLGIDE